MKASGFLFTHFWERVHVTKSFDHAIVKRQSINKANNPMNFIYCEALRELDEYNKRAQAEEMEEDNAPAVTE